MLTLLSRLLRATIRRLRIVRRIQVTLIGTSGDLALVCIRQGLLGRMLFLEAETELYCTRAHSSRRWICEGCGDLVTDRRLHSLLERAWLERARSRILSDCYDQMQSVIGRA